MNKFKYVIFDMSEANKIVLEELLRFSAVPLRVSALDKTKCYAKYIGDMPPCIQALSTKSQEYSNAEILPFIIKEPWTDLRPF